MAGLGVILRPTPRQYEVLGAYTRFGGVAAAAGRLGVSPKTVHSHLTALRSRLGAHNEAQAVHLVWLAYARHVQTCAAPKHRGCAEVERSARFFESVRADI